MFKNNHFNEAFACLQAVYKSLQELEDLSLNTELEGTARYDKLAKAVEAVIWQADSAFTSGTTDLLAAINSRSALIIKAVK